MEGKKGCSKCGSDLHGHIDPRDHFPPFCVFFFVLFWFFSVKANLSLFITLFFSLPFHIFCHIFCSDEGAEQKLEDTKQCYITDVWIPFKL